MTDTIAVEVNGEDRHLPDGATVTDLLAQLDMLGRPCAVEVNRAIVPRSTHERHRLQAGDRVEIVSFVGGG